MPRTRDDLSYWTGRPESQPAHSLAGSTSSSNTPKGVAVNPHDFKRWRQALILSSLLAGCGGAENDVETPPQSRANPEKHCVGKAQAVKPGEQLSALSAETQETCFPTFSEAISFATRGAVQLPATAKPADLKEEHLKAGAASSMSGVTWYLIGLEYEHAAYGGSSFAFYATEPCGSILYGTMPAGWDNIISSSRSFSQCNHSWHFENPNFSGAVVDCGSQCDWLGDAMNDRTSSIFWTQ
jgi:hypothetical protein